MKKQIYNREEVISIIAEVMLCADQVLDHLNNENSDISDEDLFEMAVKDMEFKVTGLDYIASERFRQIEVEGYDTNHDSQYYDQELADAAICYLVDPNQRDTEPFQWPFDECFWKPTPEDRNRELSKAGALTAGQIDVELNKNK